jgi:exonuclease III
MKVISINVFEGGHGKVDNICEWLKTQKPDVVCIQEANNWSDNNFEICQKVVEQTGLQFYQYGHSYTRYDTAIFSGQQPIAAGELNYRLTHSITWIELPFGNDTVKICNWHADPRLEDFRLFELRDIKKSIDMSGTVVWCGDFNSLSPSDITPELQQRILTKGIEKFGIGSVRSEVMSEVAAWGFIDVAELLGMAAPTQDLGIHDPQYGSPISLRIDHIMVKDIAHQRIQGFQTVMGTNFSDHRPLILELNERN